MLDIEKGNIAQPVKPEIEGKFRESERVCEKGRECMFLTIFHYSP